MEAKAAEPPQCRSDLPLSVVLGAGGVRGLAHVAVLQTLLDSGFRIQELAGTSIGAIVAGFYGAVGLDLKSIRQTGLSLKSRHLMAWAGLRRLPAGLRGRWQGLAGVIPEHMEWLAQASFERMHHGLTRIGLVSYDRLSGRQVVCHNAAPVVRLEDAVRGAAAVPGLFPAWKCTSGGRQYCLVDAGGLPVEAMFEPPFAPVQVLAVDISANPTQRQRHLERIQSLRQRFPHIPIDCLCLDTLEGASVVYRSSYAERLLEMGRAAAADYVLRATRAQSEA
jgi:NTE family protein